MYPTYLLFILFPQFLWGVTLFLNARNVSFYITFIIWILWNDGHSVLGLPTDIFCLTDAHCQTLFNSKVVSRLLNETSFDLVIIDYMANECSIALAA